MYIIPLVAIITQPSDLFLAFIKKKKKDYRFIFGFMDVKLAKFMNLTLVII